jgi:hypothetical protein
MVNSVAAEDGKSKCSEFTRLPAYLKLVDFKHASLIWKCEHILFFVTVASGLRTNMTALIIQDRLHSLGVGTQEGEVQNILEYNPGLFRKSDRVPTARVGEHEYDIADPLKPGEKAYELTDSAIKELTEKVNARWAELNWHWWDEWDVVVITGLIGVMLIAIFVLGVWECATSGVSCLDFNAFKERLSLAQLSNARKSTYFLYYITENMQLIHDMTPEVISERMSEANIAKISANDIRSYFLSHPKEVIPSTARPGPFKLSETKAKEIKETLEIKHPPGVTMMWVLHNLPLTTTGGAFAIFFSAVGAAFLAGRVFGGQRSLKRTSAAFMTAIRAAYGLDLYLASRQGPTRVQWLDQSRQCVSVPSSVS